MRRLAASRPVRADAALRRALLAAFAAEGAGQAPAEAEGTEQVCSSRQNDCGHTPALWHASRAPAHGIPHQRALLSHMPQALCVVMVQVLQAFNGACSYFEGLASQRGRGADFDCAYDAVMALHALVELAEATAGDGADRSACADTLQAIRGAPWAASLPSPGSRLLCTDNHLF